MRGVDEKESSDWPSDTASEKTTYPRDIGRWVTGVTEPTIAVLSAPGAGPHTAIVICPGGGYGGLALDWEGYYVANWLNKIGVTGIVLKYRMPRPDITKDGKPLPFLDAQQAMRMVRQHASE